MTVHLLNAAVMPAANGTYTSAGISVSEFAERAVKAYDAGNLISYVGYRSTAVMLSDLVGFEIQESRAETRLEDGDVLLIVRVKYRLGNKKNADMEPTLDDMEFRVVYYSESRNII